MHFGEESLCSSDFGLIVSHTQCHSGWHLRHKVISPAEMAFRACAIHSNTNVPRAPHTWHVQSRTPAFCRDLLLWLHSPSCLMGTTIRTQSQLDTRVPLSTTFHQSQQERACVPSIRPPKSVSSSSLSLMHCPSPGHYHLLPGVW